MSSNKSSSTLVVTAIFDSSTDSLVDSSFYCFCYSCFGYSVDALAYSTAAAETGSAGFDGSAEAAAAGAAAAVESDGGLFGGDWS